MYILGINGSPSENGNTYRLLSEIMSVCEKKGAKTEIINAAACVSDAKAPFCTSCSSPCSKACYKGTSLEDAYEKMRKADALVMGSPVYFGEMTAQLKAFLDKGRIMRSEKALIGKPCGFVTCGANPFGGQESTIRAMQSSALVYGMTIIGPGSTEYDAAHLGACAVQPADKDETALKRCRSMAERIIAEITRG